MDQGLILRVSTPSSAHSLAADLSVKAKSAALTAAVAIADSVLRGRSARGATAVSGPATGSSAVPMVAACTAGTARLAPSARRKVHALSVPLHVKAKSAAPMAAVATVEVARTVPSVSLDTATPIATE